jgi:two-component SAPR family response regulator
VVGRVAMRRVLVVEDDILIAMDIEQLLVDAGCDVVGPVARVSEALELLNLNNVDAALLDINLGTELVFPVADALDESGIPFVLVSGHTKTPVPNRHCGRPLVTKPYSPRHLLTALAAVLDSPRERVSSGN